MKHLVFLLLFGLAFLGCSEKEEPLPDTRGYVFFLVSEFDTEKGDSYILPLSNADDIAAARNIIAHRNDETLDRLVVAKVEASDGTEDFLNKDLLRNKTWSWKVTEFYGFAGSTIEIIDGGPQDVEKDMDWWFDNTSQEPDSGTIGFWGYTVVREVNPQEIKR